MEPTPQDARSSKSPRFPNAQPHFDYPSPAQSDSRYRSTESLQGLGLYTDTMAGSSLESGGLGGHDQISSNICWTPTLQHRNTPASSNSTPNVLSAEYDPFAPLHHPTPSFSHDFYSAHPGEAAAQGSPLLSGNTSQRSSFSSAPTSEIFTQVGSIHSYTPRIKMEEPTDFSTGSDTLNLSPPQLSQGLLVTSASPFPGSLDATYYHEQTSMGWAKVDYSNGQELPSISSLPIPQYYSRSESQESGPPVTRDSRKQSNIVARTRQPRKMTSKEDANFQCHVKGCGKLFGRSYNYKAHMETHDVSREYPFLCMEKDCTKKFVRKTDLQRHHQSVHMKQRNFRCDFCSRLFARKDTLRRHMEDGCSKRFDIETVDFELQGLSNGEPNIPKTSAQSTAESTRPSLYGTSKQYSTPLNSSTGHVTSSGHLMTSSAPYLERHEYLTAGDNHVSVWQH